MQTICYFESACKCLTKTKNEFHARMKAKTQQKREFKMNAHEIGLCKFYFYPIQFKTILLAISA